MREYSSWSFSDKSFVWAVLVSLLWHFFWFFSVSIVVSPRKNSGKPAPKIVALGPVFDDTLFRTLVESRIPHSEAFYRRLSDFSAPVEVEVQKAERHASGDVVSVPTGQRFTDSLKALMGGEKFTPGDNLSSRVPLRYTDDGEVFSDEERKRREEEERRALAGLKDV